MLVYTLTIQDEDTGKIYKTGYKFDHSRMADEVDSEVADCGGVEGALDEGILEEIEGKKNG